MAGTVELASIPTLAAMQRAQAALSGVANATPLHVSRTLGTRIGASVWLKPECLQRTGSFKFRGAYTKIAGLSSDERSRGVITYSSGNHAQGVACAAALLNTRSVIVMPEDAVPAKVDATRGYGAQVVFRGLNSLERQQRALELQAEFGYTVVPPFDDTAIITGQGTVGLEIVAELPDVDVVLVPVGGGGLISGTALALKLVQPHITVIGVEPSGGSDAQQSVRSGHIVTLDHADTIADGLRTVRIGSLNFEIMRRYLDDIVTVTDDEIRDAMRFILQRAKLVVEPSGAVGVAAALAGKVNLAGKRVVIVLSGGNVDSGLLSSVLLSKHEH